MDTPAQTSLRGTTLTPSPSVLLRAAVVGVALSGASALVWAGVLAGGTAQGFAIAGAVVALAGALVWEFRPRVGYAILAGDGAAVMIASVFALLAQGTVPWVLVAFWGGTAVVLAALLHLIGGDGPERSTTVTVVAVISLLALSALGLGEYVRSTWTPGELAMLRGLPVYGAGQPGPAAAVKTSAPVSGGEWGASWSVVTTEPVGQFSRMRQRLTADGWSVESRSDTSLRAEKDGYRLELEASVSPEPIAPNLRTKPVTAGDAFVMHLIAHVSENPQAGDER